MPRSWLDGRPLSNTHGGFDRRPVDRTSVLKKRNLLMSSPAALSVNATALGRGDAYRSLTRTDLCLCVLPIAVFLSIVSLV